MSRIPIRTALISVSDKTGMVEFATFLSERGIQLLSTGGTAKTLREAGLEVKDVSELTGFPEMMDGRVKTLHPNVHGGLLARRDVDAHREAMRDHNIGEIDLLVINLYPFEEAVAKGADVATCIENIDIGGPAMIRSAAKNHDFVSVITSPADYAEVTQCMKEHDGATTLELRQHLALQAFTCTARYDTAISDWMSQQAADEEVFPPALDVTAHLKQVLRYGENPHQSAALYTDGSVAPSIATASQLQGKELSYNNIADTDAALELVSEFRAPAAAIIKHANPCGVAVGGTLEEAFARALSCDPVSAFGGIIAFNQAVSQAVAEKIGKLFVEVIIAPEIEAGAREIFAKKKNLRLLETGAMPDASSKRMLIKSVGGGFLLQQRDHHVLDETALKVVTKRQPSEAEMQDLRFAFTVCKHVKSNAIVLVKDVATIGIGAGQMSRVDSARVAAHKAEHTATSVANARGAVVASDAFFPFADGVESVAEHGVRAVIQPGGSIRDEEVIEAADAHDIAMVFTGMRHFRH